MCAFAWFNKRLDRIISDLLLNNLDIGLSAYYSDTS